MSIIHCAQFNLIWRNNLHIALQISLTVYFFFPLEMYSMYWGGADCFKICLQAILPLSHLILSCLELLLSLSCLKASGKTNSRGKAWIREFHGLVILVSNISPRPEVLFCLAGKHTCHRSLLTFSYSTWMFGITHAMLQCTCQSCWCVWKLRVTQAEGLGRRKGEEDALIILTLTDTVAEQNISAGLTSTF